MTAGAGLSSKVARIESGVSVSALLKAEGLKNSDSIDNQRTLSAWDRVLLSSQPGALLVYSK